MEAITQQAIVAIIRDAESESLRVEADSRARIDELALEGLIRGETPHHAQILAWVARTPMIMDAIAQVAQVYRLREQVAARKAGAR